MAPDFAGRAGLVRATHSLTAREVVIAPAVASGLTNAEIAEKLVTSLSTVKGHIASIQAKLDARNRVEVAVWAWRSGLCSTGTVE